MSRRLVVYGFAYAIALSAPLLAQNPPQTPPAQPTGQPSASVQAEANMVRIEGCVFKEIDAPGRKVPDDVRSRVETDDDYVLANPKMIQGSAPPAAAAEPQPTGTSGTASSSMMYKVKDIGKAKLKDEVGHRVQIDGVLQHVDRAGKPLTFAFDLVELRGTTMRRVEGECPATK
jgi:hypothetical protein